MKTIDQLRERKRILLERKAYELSLQEQGKGDNMALFFVEEELLDINAQIRELEPSHRVGRSRVTHNAFAADRHQYTEWTRQDGEDNSGERAAMFQAIEQAEDLLTPAQKRTFDLWRTGMTMDAIGKELGVQKSTVSRTVARAKRIIRESLEISGPVKRDGEWAVLDASDPDAAAAILSCMTAKQAVCVYLYYGEGLSMGKISMLVGVVKSSVAHTIHRGLANISKALGYQHVEIENLETLGDLAYNLYFEGYEPPETIGTLEKGPDWGRVALGEKPRDAAYWKNYRERPITVSAARNQNPEPGKLLRALQEMANASWIYRCLSALFEKIRSMARRKERAQDKEEK